MAKRTSGRKSANNKVRLGKRKRGVVLLVVISLLALFVLIGVTYAIVAGTYKRAAQAGARYNQWNDDPRDYLDRAFYQLMRDTTHRSSIQGHSLLADLYGNDGVVGQVTVLGGTDRRIRSLGRWVNWFSSVSRIYRVLTSTCRRNHLTRSSRLADWAVEATITTTARC